MFGTYARNVIAGQGRYRPDRSEDERSSNLVKPSIEQEPSMAKQIAVKTTQTRLIHRTNVNGLSHGDYGLLIDKLNAGQELVLIAHDDNSYDNKAVGVYVENEDGAFEIDGKTYSHIGWLPNNLDESKGAKKVLWNLLDAGLTLRCKILSHDPKANFATRLFVGIWIVQ